MATKFSDFSDAQAAFLVGYNGANNVKVLAPAELYDYLIYFDGSTYQAVNGTTRVSAGSNANFNTLLNTVTGLDSLRTGRYTFAIIGEVTVTAAPVIELPSFTALVVLGAMQCDGGATNYFITNADRAGGTTKSVSIRGGGSIDGGITAGIGGSSRVPVEFENCANVTIDNVEVRNSNNHLINLKDVTGFRVTNCTLHGSGDDGLSVLSTSGGGSNAGYIAGNTIWRMRDDGAGTPGDENIGASCIELEDGTSDCIIANNTCYRGGDTDDRTQYGVNVTTDANGEAFNWGNITITGNAVSNVAGNGIQAVMSQSTDNTLVGFNVAITGNVINGCVAGISARRVDGLSITGNTITGTTSKGMIVNSCRNAVVASNTIIDSGTAVVAGANAAIECGGIRTTPGLEGQSLTLIGNTIRNYGLDANKGFGINVSDYEHVTSVGNVIVDTRGEAGTGIFYGIRYFDCQGLLSITNTSTAGTNTGTTSNGVRNQQSAYPQTDCIGDETYVDALNNPFVFSNQAVAAV